MIYILAGLLAYCNPRHVILANVVPLVIIPLTDQETFVCARISTLNVPVQKFRLLLSGILILLLIPLN